MFTFLRGKEKMKKYIILLVITMLFVTGCSNSENKKVLDQKKENSQNTSENGPQDTESPDLERLKEIGANELGRIMIIEYHVIGEEDGRWARSYTSFRKDLEKLYEADYVAVSLNDMIRGSINVPEGKTPVVITFDDGSQGQFRYLENEEGKFTVDPKSGVGVLEQFYEEYPEFGLEATFFLNYYTPFGQSSELSKKKISHIIEAGMDIGNHSVNHLKMNKLNKEEVAKELVPIVEMIKEIVPEYKVETFALPFGLQTQEIEWSVKGEYDGSTYENIGVLLVGSTPVASPYSTKFSPYALERVQVFEDNLDKWIQFFVDNPDQKYISDGFSEIITIPEGKRDILNPNLTKEVLAY